MKLENEKINNRRMYSAYYCPDLNKYVLNLIVTWAVWYPTYYEITEEEYNSFDTPEFDKFARELYDIGSKSDRFLYSDMAAMNTEASYKFIEKYGYFKFE